MAIHDDGNGPYTIREDGTKDYGQLTEFSINDESVVRFDADTGTLFLSTSPEDCKRLSSLIDEDAVCSPTISFPGFLPGMPEELKFENVKKIVSLEPGESGYHFSVT